MDPHLKRKKGRSSDRPFLSLGILLVLAGAAFLLRASPLLQAPPGEQGPFLLNPDALYHLRMARLISADFPRPPSFDPYLNFPEGAPVPWPFLQDLTTAAAARLLPFPGPGALERVSVFYPPVMGALAVILVFALARALGMGSLPSLAAAGLSSIFPAQFAHTFAGEYDHHSGDLVYALLFFLALVVQWRDRVPGGRTGRGILPPAFLSLASLLMLMNWIGSILYLGMALLAAGLLTAFSRPRDPALMPFLRKAGASLVASSLALGLVWSWAYGERILSLASGIPSGFQPLSLLGSGLLLLLLAEFLSGKGLKNPRGAGLLALLTLLAAAGAGSFLRGFDTYLADSPGLSAQVGEAEGPFTDRLSDLSRPSFSLETGVRHLTWAVFLFPFAWLGFLWKGPDGRGTRDLPWALFLSLGAVQFPLALSQYRYGNLFTVPCAIGSAWLLWALAARARDRARPPWARGAFLLAAVLVLLSFLPAPSVLARRLGNPRGVFFTDALVGALDNLKRISPSPSDPQDPGERPSYGILAPWDEGHHVITFGERPSMATPFMHTLPGGLYWESFGILLEEDPEKAFVLMEGRRLRYVVLHNFFGALLNSYLSMGDVKTYRRLRAEGEAALLYREGRAPVSLRLWDHFGSAVFLEGRAQKAARHFRLVWEERFPYPALQAEGRARIFEAVPGARLEGTAPGGSFVRARLELVDNAGRPFSYEDGVQAGPAGDFSLTLPYANRGGAGPVRPLGPWLLRADGPAGTRSARVEVTEEDVREGKAVRVAL